MWTSFEKRKKANGLTCKSLAWTKWTEFSVTVTVWLEVRVWNKTKHAAERHSKPPGTSANKTGLHLSFSCEIIEVKNDLKEYRIIIWSEKAGCIRQLACCYSSINTEAVRPSTEYGSAASNSTVLFLLPFSPIPANNEQLICDKIFAKCQC